MKMEDILNQYPSLALAVLLVTFLLQTTHYQIRTAPLQAINGRTVVLLIHVISMLIGALNH